MLDTDLEARRMDRLNDLHPRGCLQLADGNPELEVHLTHRGVVDHVLDPLPAKRFFKRRVGDQHPRRCQRLKRFRDGRHRETRARGDLASGGCAVVSDVSDDAGAHHAAESLNGVLHVVGVEGSRVSGHVPILSQAPRLERII